MKRIDEKIKEIEKRDKFNRWMFYGIIVLIIGFIYYASTTQKTIDAQKGTISEQLVQIKKQLETEQSLTKQLDDSIKELKRSLKPDEYWKYIKNENTVEGYIGFLTNDWGIDKTGYLTKAYDKLLLDNEGLVGYDGWIWVGTKKWSDDVYESKGFIKIISRKDGKKIVENSEPEVGDIVQLKTPTNRNTYKKNICKGKTNDYGWRNKTKGIVVEVYHVPDKTDINIRVKYY